MLPRVTAALLFVLAPKAAQRLNLDCFCSYSSVVYKSYFRHIYTGVNIVAILIMMPNYYLNRVRVTYVNKKILNIELKLSRFFW